MTSTENVILHVDKLVKHFPIMRGIIFSKTDCHAVHVVDGVSFDIHKGETLGLGR